MKLRVSEVQTVLNLIHKEKEKIASADVTIIFYNCIIKQMSDEDFKKYEKDFLSFLCSLYISSAKNKKTRQKRMRIIDEILEANALLEKRIKELSEELNLSEDWIENKLGEIAQKTKFPVDECVKILKNNLNY